MTPSLGNTLSSEEQPVDLVRHAQMAEDAGFDFGLISDHCHPWTDRPFVWSVRGAIAQATRRLVVGTAVTCPTMRIHPALVAQAAATTAALMPLLTAFDEAGGTAPDGGARPRARAGGERADPIRWR